MVFTGPPKTEQVLWPRHCVQESWGAELHKDLKVEDDDNNDDHGNNVLLVQVHPKGRVIYKGVNPNIDSYSAFFDNSKLGKTCLEELIRNEGCTDVYVCGIATDVCVGKIWRIRTSNYCFLLNLYYLPSLPFPLFLHLGTFPNILQLFSLEFPSL